MNPLPYNSLICFLSSSSSLTPILYGLLAMGAVPGSNSIINSMSRSGGIPGYSSRKHLEIHSLPGPEDQHHHPADSL